MYTRYITVSNKSSLEKQLLADVAFKEFEENNCTFPHIARIIYRTKDENTSTPILTTVVFFVDGSKVVVKNSKHDSIVLEDKKLSDGSTIKVPTAQSMEVALLYAVVKRMFSTFDINGKTDKCCFGNFIKNVTKLASIENVSEAEAKIDKARAKKAYNEMKANAKPKKRRYSIHETLEKMNEVLDKIAPYMKSDEKSIAATENKSEASRIEIPVTDGSEKVETSKSLNDISNALEKISKIFKD